MAYNDLIGGALTSGGKVRNEPVQARSSERIGALLDAASQVVSEVGIERLTTAMVAERAGASIGTVYRYFPDRIAVLAALSLRSFERFLRAGVEKLDAAKPDTLVAAFDCLIDAAAELHRTEPGYTSIRLSDQVALPEVDGGSAIATRTAGPLAAVFVSELGITDDGTLAERLDVALTVADALLVRAFIIDPAGDEAAIAVCRAVVATQLA
ncbi:TetR family transcriptional regulator [Herbiconiux moechotypicola]|uniref:HTH tetR-type domain-containing protein n=1 Tax=Herbiconiux moechotypicola TaxID=637393 RepID=A0ABP5QDS4_9MICO|nr:TetR/AcrR family transcriptional regulator [Herbiconiux moechotypicola]MCS5729845.1 TetR family transcriptional regulator [Herbiconiux moechotypicola]